MKHYPGFTRLELLVTLVVAGIIAMVLLDRLRYYQEAAEKADMEYAIRMIKGELRIHMASMLTRGRAQEYVTLIGKNPVEWMEQKPWNYRGSLRSPAIADAAPGNWYFDQDQRVLVYLVRTGRYFVSAHGDGKQVRMRIVAVPNEVGADVDITVPSTASVTLEVEPYRWF